MKHDKHIRVVSFGAIALAVSATASGSWVKTYDFNDASSWTNGTGNSIGGSGLWSSSGFGQGLAPRSFNSGATSAYESGAMRMTVSGGGYGGARLFLNGSGSQTQAQVRQEFVDAMDRQWAPETSIQINSAGTGVVAFGSLAVPVGGNPQGFAAGDGTYVGLTVDFTQGQVFLGFNFARTSGGISLLSGWNTLKVGLTTSGVVQYFLNNSLVGSASGTFDYLANAADSAINIYGDTYFSPGYANPTGNVSALFDNLVVSSSIPAPGALALLGLAGLAGARRRRA